MSKKDIARERDRETERQRDRETERQRDRETETETEKGGKEGKLKERARCGES